MAEFMDNDEDIEKKNDLGKGDNCVSERNNSAVIPQGNQKAEDKPDNTPKSGTREDGTVFHVSR